MNIVLSNDAKTIAGGENYVLYLADGLRNKGHNVFIAPMCNSELSRVANSNGFPVTPTPYGKGGKEFKAVSVLFNQLKNNKIDIVHSNSNLDRTVAAIAGRLLKVINFSSVHLCMSINRNLTHAIRNRFLIDRFTPVGFATKKILVEKDRIPPDKVSVVHIGLPENKFLFDPESRKKIRYEFNILKDEIVVGTVSRLVEFKGHIYLMKAFSELQKTYPNFRLLIIGDGPLKQELLTESKNLNIEQLTIFAGSRKDISEILSAMDVFAQTSKDFGGESFPVSILEAMSVGLPVIASNVGDINCMINDSNGFLIKPENINDIINSLNVLMESETLRKEFGSNSRKLFTQKFTINKMIDEMEGLYLKELSTGSKKNKFG